MSRLTLDQFLELPETEPASELICGEVVRKPMPNEAHATLQLYLGMLILQLLMRTSIGRVGSEWRCIFGPAARKRTVVPDVTYVSSERYEAGRPHKNGYLRVAPDLAIEVLSPRQHAARFAGKIQFYLANGVQLVWVIDPKERTVTVLRPDDEALILHAGDTLDGDQVLPGFSVALDDIFAQLPE